MPHKKEQCVQLDTYAVIDIGSNKFHLIIAQRNHASFNVIARFNHYVRLASGLTKTGNLIPQNMTHGLHCLINFRKMIARFPQCHVRIIATYALRAAHNRMEFIHSAKSVIPYPIEVISGDEEARLIYFALAQQHRSFHESILVIDIGGGSTEVAYGKGKEIQFATSLPIGCITLSEQFFADKHIDALSFYQAKWATTRHLKHISPQHASIAAFTEGFGTSGGICLIHDWLQEMGYTDGKITNSRVTELLDHLFLYTHCDDLPYSWLTEDKKIILMAMLAILMGLFETLSIKTLYYSPCSLHDGIIYEMLAK